MDESKEKAICNLYKSGKWTLQEIGYGLNVSYNKVVDILEKNDIKINKTKK